MKTITELKQMNLPTALINLSIKDDSDIESLRQRKFAEEYLNEFLPLNNNCICCDSELGGILGSCRWDIAYGECYCGECGYPGRARHEIKDDNDNIILTINNILQYHPNVLEENHDE